MAENVKELKNALREKYKLCRRNISPRKKKELDEAICGEIISLSCFRLSDTVLAYYPIGSEIDVIPVALEALKKGKKVAFPLCDTETCTMTYKYVNDLSELVSGSYSIHEPLPSAPDFSGGENVLCLVPALAFDKDGFRLGYGKGYYDRFLKSFRGTSLGAVYHELLTDTLPRGYHDIAADVLVTERGSMITNAGKEKLRG
ncbi:MAG: 5-formyltetrahydrofolate cyclo-ligase [Clostridia bacterium]|nr:5-formyltetrahydrofolate cyclo-ligase [Clostridia bacterium]